MEIGLQLEVIYLNKGELRELAGKLRGFPNSSLDARDFTLGAFGPKTAGGHVLINFHCTDGSGHAHVEAKIESNDAAGSRQSATLFLPIEASAVDSFVDALSGLEESVNAAAFLTSTIIPR